MNPRNRRGGAPTAFPTHAQSLALRAALLDGDRALQAWREMLTVGTPDDEGIAWIAPLLMSNISRLSPDDAWVSAHPHFLTIAKLRSRAITSVAERALSVLHESGVRTLALKGVALGATVYPSPALRAVLDIDILVPQAETFPAFDALKRAGFTSGDGEPRGARSLRTKHAHAFYSARKHDPSIDVHWHLLESARQDFEDEPFWDKAQPSRIGTTETRVLCPEHQLLHVLVHGVRWTASPHVRWVADAVLLLRRYRGTFRSDVFLEAVERFAAAAPVKAGLKFVHEFLSEGDGEAFETVMKLKPSRFSEKAFKARATAYKERTVTDRLALRIESALWKARAGRKTKPSGR